MSEPYPEHDTSKSGIPSLLPLGHKAIASESPLANRVHFINAQVEVVDHSEEHMVLKTKDVNSLNVGDVLYRIPFHVYPTVALHDGAYTVVNYSITGFGVRSQETGLSQFN